MTKTTLIIAFSVFILSSCGGTSDTEKSQEELQSELSGILNPTPKQNIVKVDSTVTSIEMDSAQVSE